VVAGYFITKNSIFGSYGCLPFYPGKRHISILFFRLILFIKEWTQTTLAVYFKSAVKSPQAMKLLASLSILILLVGFSISLDDPAWYKNGDKAYAYDFITQNIEKEEVLHLRSNQESVRGFGTIMRNSSSKPFRGRKVVFSAQVKTEDLRGWVGLWMRVADSRTGEIYAYENMVREAIKDTQGWKNYSIVLDVDPDSDMISYGILLNDAGKIWMKNAKLEVFTGKDPNLKVNKTR
jgi:hypothetical protein